MKIYSKKWFASGLFLIALGVLNLAADIANGTVDAKGSILIAVLFLFGVGEIVHSLSKKLAREDWIEERDERNQLIELKSKSKSFRLVQGMCFLFMLALLVMGKLSANRDFIAMGIGLGFAFSISMFAEIATYIYYEGKN